MSFLIAKDESTADRRRVPFRLYTSNGTSPDTNASDGTILWSVNGAAQLSAKSISAISANAGMYYVEFSQSNVSVLGSIAVYTDTIATDFPQHVATVQVVNNNPMSLQSGVIIAGGSYSSTTVRLDLVAYSGATVGAGNFAPGVYSGVSFSIRDSGIATSSFQAGTYSNLTVQGVINVDSGVSIRAGTHSGATIQGLSNYANISNVTLAAGTHSNVTIQGVTRLNSAVTLNADTHSGATIQGILDPTFIWNASRSSYSAFGGFGAASQVVSVLTAQGGSTSGMTLNSAETTTDSYFNGCLVMVQYADGNRAGTIISTYSGSGRSAQFLNTITAPVSSGMTYIVYPGVDASIGVSVWSSHLTRTLSTSGERSIASSWMSTNLGNNRLAQEFLFPLRNRVQISGSTGTVFSTDDTTSSWTFSVTTADFPLSGMNPAG